MEVTQPGPFKEAWYHDFAPPIHSLDRHGDFAPPLLALGLAAGFFGVATDDDSGLGGLQYNIADTYGPHNIGDWLSVETTGFQSTPIQTSHGDQIFSAGQIFYDTGNAGIYTAYKDGARTSWRGVLSGQWLGYLDGFDDIEYLETGNFTRYTGGGDITLYTTDGRFPNTGDFNLYTSGTSDDSAVRAGDVQINTEGGSGGGGDVTLNIGRNYEANIFVADSTYVINDHNGLPLVTYTG